MHPEPSIESHHEAEINVRPMQAAAVIIIGDVFTMQHIKAMHNSGKRIPKGYCMSNADTRHCSLQRGHALQSSCGKCLRSQGRPLQGAKMRDCHSRKSQHMNNKSQWIHNTDVHAYSASLSNALLCSHSRHSCLEGQGGCSSNVAK
jgi:hypothetical protein